MSRQLMIGLLMPMLVSLASCGPKQGDAAAPPTEPTTANSAGTTKSAPASVLVPEGIDVAQTSTDPSYGFTKENPVKVGMKDEFSGPAASQVYLRHLRDKDFKPLRFERLGSMGGGPDDHMLDLYQLTASNGQVFKIYVDMYHPENTPLSQLAPVGLYFWK